MTIDNRNLRGLRMSGGYGDSRYAREECPAIDTSYICGTGHFSHSILGASA
jgi:hypothetical protein